MPSRRFSALKPTSGSSRGLLMGQEQVVTRFAPSPTGYLHIGGVRTALFSWMFSKRHGGKFRLRIEDTDRTRSTQDAIDVIFDGLSWLGLDHDGDVVFQSQRGDRHREVAEQMLSRGHAYRCYATEEEVAFERKRALKENRAVLYQSPWRDCDPRNTPDRPFAVRLKTPQSGMVRIHDSVAGDVGWKAETIDDLVLLRSTVRQPTCWRWSSMTTIWRSAMLSVAVTTSEMPVARP